jgi:hypothetical protein
MFNGVPAIGYWLLAIGPSFSLTPITHHLTPTPKHPGRAEFRSPRMLLLEIDRVAPGAL